jgi:hypothetical protein
MSSRARHLQPDGRWTTGARKTQRRNDRGAPADLPDWRVTMLVPDQILVSVGPSGVNSVEIEYDPFSGSLAVVEGKSLEWCLRQVGEFLMAATKGMDRLMTAIIARGEYRREQTVVLQPDSVEFPQRGFKTITVKR